MRSRWASLTTSRWSRYSDLSVRTSRSAKTFAFEVRKWRLEDLGTFGPEYVVEAPHVLGVPVADQEVGGDLECWADRGSGSTLFQGDHLYDEWDECEIRILVADDDPVESDVVELDRHGEGERVVVTHPVHRSNPIGNLEAEIFAVDQRNPSTRSTSIARLNRWSYSSKAIWMTTARPKF